MKAGAVYIAIFTLALLLIPMVALQYGAFTTQEAPAVHSPALPQSQTDPSAGAPPSAVPSQETVPAEAEEAHEVPEEAAVVVAEQEPATTSNDVLSFRILDQATGRVNEVSVRDYVRGAVASEMPVSFHEEALKAQAVAAHTFALRNHYMQQESPDPALKGADFAADPSNRKVYITEQTAREFYGEGYADAYWDKICQAADSVLPYILEYDDEPIVAAYHAMSAGRTEAAENVWTGSADYLVPAESGGDYLAPDYEVTSTFTQEELRSAIAGAYPDADLSGDPGGWIEILERSESGYITAAELGGVPLHGKDIRTLLDLRSHNMDIEWNGSRFAITTYGHGHGVGLSQYGADFLARQGYTFDEILANYYPGAELRIAISE